MWPYTGDENHWLGKAEPRTTAKLVGARSRSITLQPTAQGTASIDRQTTPHWLQAVERLFRPAEQHTDQNALPLIAARFKDPLNAIRDSAEALRGNPSLPQEQQVQHLDVVLKEYEHLTEMISAMLDTVAVRGKASDHA